MSRPGTPRNPENRPQGNPAQFEELEAAYTAEYAPATPTERALLDSLIHYERLLRRFRWVETLSGAPASTA